MTFPASDHRQKTVYSNSSGRLKHTTHTHEKMLRHDKYIQKSSKGMFLYLAQYPVRWTTQTALHFSHGRPVQFRHQLDFSGKHPSHAAIAHEDYPFTFPPLSIARYLFIQSLGCRGQNENGQVLLKLEYLFTDYDTWDFVVLKAIHTYFEISSGGKTWTRMLRQWNMSTK